MIREIHKIISKSFELAMRWEMIKENPAKKVLLPKYRKEERDIWSEHDLSYALSVCDDEYLSLLMNIMFACTLRTGEALGLTWDCVEISEEKKEREECCLRINKSIQRVPTEALEEVHNTDIKKKFKQRKENSGCRLVLKNPKTEKSDRIVYLPTYLVDKLEICKMHQKYEKQIYGPEYNDNDLVFASATGAPICEDWIVKKFNRFIEKERLLKVQLYSLRHSSITYKLKISNGDLKSVQGDAGHASVELIQNVYSHIQEEDRKRNAMLFEKVFYEDNNNDEEI